MTGSNLPIADKWFDIRPYQNGVTKISEKHIDPYWSGNIWVIQGSEASLVVDTGTGIVSPIPTLSSITDTPLTAVASCYYYDHAGGLNYFERRYSHSLDARAISDPSNDMGASHFNKYAEVTALPDKEFQLGAYQPNSANPIATVEDGYKFELGSRSIEVIHVPGRTPGSLVFWEEKTGYLFGGETLFVDPYQNNFPPQDVNSYEACIRRLSQLSVSTIFGGHFEPFSKNELKELVEAEIGRYR